MRVTSLSGMRDERKLGCLLYVYEVIIHESGDLITNVRSLYVCV